MKHITPIITALVLAAVPLSAAKAESQLERLVAQDLRRYAPDVDVKTLSNAQLSRIHLFLNSKDKRGGERRLIRSAINGGIIARGRDSGRRY